MRHHFIAQIGSLRPIMERNAAELEQLCNSATNRQEMTELMAAGCMTRRPYMESSSTLSGRRVASTPGTRGSRSAERGAWEAPLR